MCSIHNENVLLAVLSAVHSLARPMTSATAIWIAVSQSEEPQRPAPRPEPGPARLGGSPTPPAATIAEAGGVGWARYPNARAASWPPAGVLQAPRRFGRGDREPRHASPPAIRFASRRGVRRAWCGTEVAVEHGAFERWGTCGL